MAFDTEKNLRSQVMYSVFIRQYSQEGTFEALRKDLNRIRDLGVDIIWLMPIHPVGETRRKGRLGSPYAIQDYRRINPEYGTREDFLRLVEDIHAAGMKCVIDVVYNHTSPDSVLAGEHPEWFYHRPDGSFGNRIGDWTDIIDLDYSKKPLWEYQIETLKQWAAVVDGFRCDVASLVPLEFWLQARKEVAKVRPDCIWLSESVEPEFIFENRLHGIPCLSDSEIYQAFDICYDYDIYFDLTGYLTGKKTLAGYAAAVSRQEVIYPENYVKLRLLENHDRMRAAALIPDKNALISWTAFLYFQKGMTLLYNGQEAGEIRTPDLFEKDPVSWENGCDLSSLMRILYEIKKDPLLSEGSYHVKAVNNSTLEASYRKGEKEAVGIFPLSGRPGPVETSLPDGIYHDRITKRDLRVKDHMIQTDGRPVIFILF